MKARKFIDIRKGEVLLTFLMFSYYYLTLTTIYFLKPARDSMFLVNLGPAQLPVTFVLIALVVLPVTTFYSRLSQSLSITRLINVTIGILIVNLLILRGLIDIGQSWVFYVFYVWVSIYGVLVTAQYWLFANTLYNPPQAKRLFPVLNVGGILGAMTGGELTGFIIQTLGVSTENLLFFCMGFLGLCIVLLNIMWSIRDKDSDERPVRARTEDGRRDTFKQMVDTVRRSRSLVFIVGIISIMVIVISFVDFQFKSISVATFPDKSDLTSFLGKFYGRIGLIALLIQVLLGARLLRVLSVGGTLLFLPVSLILGSVALFIFPSLWTAVTLRGADQSFRYSLQKTAQELLFLPVPLEMKKRAKVFIDVFVDQAAQGVSGVMLLVCTLVLGLSIRSLSLIIIGLAGVWIMMAIRAHREYVEAFRKALERREIDLSALDMNIAESSTLDTLRAALGSRNERQIVYALDMLSSVQDVNLDDALITLLTHPAPEIRRKALYVMRTSRRVLSAENIEPMLQDADQGVRVEALSVLAEQSEDPHAFYASSLGNPDPKIQAAVIESIARQDDVHMHTLVTDQVIGSLLEQNGGAGNPVRIHVARALGRLNASQLQPYFRRLMHDNVLAVARSAIEGAGATRDPQYIPFLRDKLAESAYRVSARRALVNFGPMALTPLYETLTDESANIIIRSNIPRVLREIMLQESVDTLLNALEKVEPMLNYPIVKALNKLRNYPTLHIDEETVNTALIEETREYYVRQEILSLKWDDSPAADLMVKSLNDKQNSSLELMFRLLGLQYSPQDMYNAYEGIISLNNVLRSNAIEFLDNILRHNIKRYLIPVLDQASPRETIEQGRALFGHRLVHREQALIYLMRGRDTWLRACAIATVTAQASPEILHLVEEAQHDVKPIVCETSKMILRNIRQTRTA